MSTTSTPTQSVWDFESSDRGARPLSKDTTTDVCVVGAGIAGLTAAYHLASVGRSVLVLDGCDATGGGETMFTTAHLAWVFDDRFARVSSIRGDETTRLAAESHRDAVLLIGETARREKIDCEYKPVEAYLFPGADGPASLDEETEALRRLGLPFERLDRPPTAGLSGPCLRFPDHAQFHPLKYIAGLSAAFRRLGGTIHTKTRVQKIRDGEPCTLETEAGPSVTAKAVVVATGSPFDAGVVLHTKLAAYQTYAIAVEVPRGAVPHALYWDTEDPYHYVRLQPGDGETDFLIVGGEDHKTGQADDQQVRWDKLVMWTKAHFAAVGPVRYHWSGQVFETPDGLGLIGAAPWGRNVFVITGDSGMGMTHGTLGGRLVANLIEGKDGPLARVYSPSRLTPRALLTFLQENANLAAQYTAWFTGGDVKSADEIPPGHGAVIRRGLSKLAVYKDETGKVCEMSAKCPHMAAVVRWNPGEQTWDCPAHGSRFKCDGDVTHGPAVEGLNPAD